ncbi:MAG: hypothetical protein M1830_001463 [Pleopsidium flavum]|nr:MAG: hypothetical protein M1830_001463 [Pleopsidium flavum]
MAEQYIETPRTDAGNATFVNNGHNFEDFSVENSFQVPSQDENDLVKQIRNNRRGLELNTPRIRAPFVNPSAAPVHGEFTPLMKSVTKKNLLRNGQKNGVPQTPVFLKPGYTSVVESPALPAVESSAMYGDETGSSLGGEEQGTPVPQVASSSAQSTPLATLPKRDGGGLLADGANMMTLREQENIINKIEKENFGLKIKIHYLEEALRKSGPGLNEAALKENTELKVTRVTMQKELHRYKKSLSHAEHDLEAYRSQFSDLQDKVKQKHADASLREELENLRKNVEEKDREIRELKEKLGGVEHQDAEFGKLRDEIEDLQADLVARDRLIEEKEEEIDELKEHANKDSDSVAELEEDLESAQKEIQGLRDKVEHAESEASKAREDEQEARDEKQRAEDDLDEARISLNLSQQSAI